MNLETLRKYRLLEQRLLGARARGEATEAVEDEASDAMDLLWNQMRREERDVLRDIAARKRANASQASQVRTTEAHANSFVNDVVIAEPRGQVSAQRVSARASTPRGRVTITGGAMVTTATTSHVVRASA